MTHPEKVVVLTQTTLSVDDTSEIIGVLRERFPNLLARTDICYATTNRQAAVKTIAKHYLKITKMCEPSFFLFTFVYDILFFFFTPLL